MSLHIKSWFRVPLMLFILLQFYSIMSGQEEVWTSDQFLVVGQNTIDLPYEENLNFLNNKAKGMPFVDKYEFRTETNEMDFDQQQYQFRFKFNSNDERKAYDRILSANKDKYSWMQAQFELEEWEEKYKNIVDLYFLQKEFDLIIQDLILLSDKKKVLKKILDTDTQIDVSDWLSNEAEIFSLLSDSLELEVQKKEIGQFFFGSSRALPFLNETNFIQILSIKEFVAEAMSDSFQHPDEGLALAQEKLADAEFKLELAEANRWLEFAQIQYQSETKLSFQKELSFGTSITLPNKSNNRVKKNEAALELMERKYKSNIKLEENKKETYLEVAKLTNLIDQYDELKKIMKNQNLESTFDSFAEHKIVSPLILIGIKRSIVKNNKKRLNLEKDIYDSYINLLTQRAAFLKVPWKNYLLEIG